MVRRVVNCHFLQANLGSKCLLLLVQHESNWENRLKCTEAILGNKISKNSTVFVDIWYKTRSTYLPLDHFNFSQLYLVRLLPKLLASKKKVLIRGSLTIRLPQSLVLTVISCNKYGISWGRGFHSLHFNVRLQATQQERNY